MKIIIKKGLSILLTLCVFFGLCRVSCFTSSALDTSSRYFYGNHAKNPLKTAGQQGFTPVMTPVATTPEGSLNPDDLLVPPKQTDLEEKATRWGLQGQAWNGALQWKNYTAIRSDGRILPDKCAAGVRFDVKVSGDYTIKADFFNNAPANGHYHYVFLKSGSTISTLYSYDTNDGVNAADRLIEKGTMVQTFERYLKKGDILYFVIDSKGQSISGVYKNLEVAIDVVADPTTLDKVRVFSVPEEFPQYEVKYEVTVDDTPMGLYSDKNSWDQSINFGLFELREGETAEVSVTPSFDFETYKILPDNLGIESTRVDNTITYQVSDTTAKLSFVFDNDYKGSTLHLFTNPIDDDAPTESIGNVIYYGPGYHRLYETNAKKLSLQSDYTIYLAGGAVLEGCAVGQNVENVTITGSGMMLSYHPDSEWPADKHGRCVSLKGCKNIAIKNIMSHVHRTKDWTTVVQDSSNVAFENYKVVSPQWASTDAMGIINSSDVNIKNSFLRSADDTITLKGLADTPESGLPIENITVEHTQLWNEVNSAMVVGEEARAQYYKNIRFSDIDVLFSYDDKYYHGQLDERSVMSIVLLNGTSVEDIVWENIRVNECERLVCFKFTDTFYMGSTVGDQSTPGYIKNVTVKNVTSNSTSDSEIANEILIQGWDENKTISNVAFENIVINGEKLLSTDTENFVTNDYVSDITIDAPTLDNFEPTVFDKYSFGYYTENSFETLGQQNFWPVFGASHSINNYPIWSMETSNTALTTEDYLDDKGVTHYLSTWKHTERQYVLVRADGRMRSSAVNTVGVAWVAPQDGRYSYSTIINFYVDAGVTREKMHYGVFYGSINGAEGNSQLLYDLSISQGDSGSFESDIYLNKGDRLYFILDMGGESMNGTYPNAKITIEHMDAPEAPVVTDQTATSVTLKATEGYEYGYAEAGSTNIIEANSNVIENLQIGAKYNFYQRKKVTGAVYESDYSQALVYTMFRPGDVDYSGKINKDDLIAMRNYLLELQIEADYFEGLMDANVSDSIDIRDLVAINKKALQGS